MKFGCYAKKPKNLQMIPLDLEDVRLRFCFSCDFLVNPVSEPEQL